MAFNSENTEFGGKLFETLYPINELDSYNGEELKKYTVEVVSGIDAVIINFTKVSYLNSSGLRELIQILKLMKENNKSFFLTSVNKEIMKIFVSTNLNRLFSIHESNEDAMKSFA
ncbi:anti-sigma-factor antagonist [Denitrovibrio acetiphilus DSM 12809]|uniref:Anti-sigma factor antagonist n=1 Tax=Denitrovibrio acetiphilus (strain DSM 12809 / NBRC 114555 / N2460) TaxID=522772 RepID=D4H106_DENA2|nr:STAS domain-containing protein [Denitrovibrio acetiphilus]ADD68669.1 anti-sigma-factor antagonist [Denitrovibrio acetiphilus DSM 12809]